MVGDIQRQVLVAGTGSTWSLDVMLRCSIHPSGLLEARQRTGALVLGLPDAPLPPAGALPQPASGLPITYTVAGTCAPRLSEAGAGGSTPYRVGVNGVVSVSADRIGYRLDGIDYVTELGASGTTRFSVVRTFVPDADGGQTVTLPAEGGAGYAYKPRLSADIAIDRGERTALDSHYRLMHIASLSELDRYGGNHFSITGG